jgi:hypothetical protein
MKNPSQSPSGGYPLSRPQKGQERTIRETNALEWVDMGEEVVRGGPQGSTRRKPRNLIRN